MSTHILFSKDRNETIILDTDDEILDKTRMFVGHRLTALKVMGRNCLADVAKRDETKAEARKQNPFRSN